MELTFRQKAFLSRVLDLYQEAREPFHYSVVAKRLGVSKSTAYDMLRLLEQKGLVACEYVTPKVTPGPGRSSILFSPTTEATILFSRLAGADKDQEEWEELKTRILTRLRQGSASDYDAMLHELLALIPEAHSPLVRCAEIITALLIGVREARHKFGERSPVSMFLAAPVSKLGMSTLAGIALGLCIADQAVERLLGDFREHANGYEAALEELNAEDVGALHRFSQEVDRALTAKTGL
jgi:DNA-binding MarR family transcriptional regulator